MLLFSLIVLAAVLIVLAAASIRGLSHISEILEIDESEASTPARSPS